MQSHAGQPEAKARGHGGTETGLGAAQAEPGGELLLQLGHEDGLPHQLAAERRHYLRDLRPFLLLTKLKPLVFIESLV